MKINPKEILSPDFYQMKEKTIQNAKLEYPLSKDGSYYLKAGKIYTTNGSWMYGCDIEMSEESFISLVLAQKYPKIQALMDSI